MWWIVKAAGGRVEVDDALKICVGNLSESWRCPATLWAFQGLKGLRVKKILEYDSYAVVNINYHFFFSSFLEFAYSISLTCPRLRSHPNPLNCTFSSTKPNSGTLRQKQLPTWNSSLDSTRKQLLPTLKSLNPNTSIPVVQAGLRSRLRLHYSAL